MRSLIKEEYLTLRENVRIFKARGLDSLAIAIKTALFLARKSKTEGEKMYLCNLCSIVCLLSLENARGGANESS